jgi:hypothetical protein
MLLLRIDLMHLQVASLDYQHPSNLRVRGLLLFACVKALRTHRSFESLVVRGRLAMPEMSTHLFGDETVCVLCRR